MPDDRDEIMMPTKTADAVHLIEIEVLRGISRNLEKLNERSDEQLEKLHSMDARLVRIEANKLDRTVEALRKEVDVLKADKERRDARSAAANWMLKYLPTLTAMIVAVLVAVVLTLKASGRL